MDGLVFVYPPSDSLCCTLHKGFFNTPVIARCGHTFCRTCVVQPGKPIQCPLDRTALRQEDFIPNLAVSQQINDLLVYCRYGTKVVDGKFVVDSQGCPKQIKYGAKLEHETTCDYAPAQCPYNESCPPLTRGQLQKHQSTCTHIPCPHKSAGCNFEGNRSVVDDHLLNCGYESIKDYIARNEEQLNSMKQLLEDKTTENDFLRKSIIQLTSRFDQLAMKLEAKNSKFEATIRHLQASLEATQGQLSDTVGEMQSLRRIVDLDDVEPQTTSGLHLLKCMGTIAGHNGPVWALAVMNNILISASSDTTIKLWDLQTFKCKHTLTGHEGIVHAIAVIGNRLFSGSSDKKIRVWDLETRECIRVLEDHDNTVCTLVVASGYLFSGSYTHLKVWDLETYQCIETLKGHNHWVRAVCVNHGFLFSASYNIVKIWDLANFQCVKTLTGNCGSIYSIVVANRRLIAGSYENAIIAWDLDTYEMVRLEGHIGAVYAVSVSANRLFSGSYDSTIKVWNLDTLVCVQTLNRHTSSVDALTVYHSSIFSGSADNTIKVWR